LVHYRAERLLRECLDKLMSSRFRDFTAVIIDNGSNTGLDWAERYPQVRVASVGRNIGYAAGVNLAFEILPGKTPYVLLLNPDVLLENDTLGEMIRLLDERSKIGAATCKLMLPSGRIDPAARRSDPNLFSALSKQIGLQRLFPGDRRFGSYNLTHLDPSKPHEIGSGTGAFLLLRREALEAAGGLLDCRFFLYGEDLDLCRRIRMAGYRILYWPAVTALHIKGSGRIRDATTTVHFYKAMWTYYRKWGKFHRSPVVLLPLALAIGALCLAELGKNRLLSMARAPRSC
jgi:GT2 family glycosyltransferase